MDEPPISGEVIGKNPFDLGIKTKNSFINKPKDVRLAGKCISFCSCCIILVFIIFLFGKYIFTLVFK